jgi:response regulator RpfG family c-di-GMP phosphodiesterase
MRFVNTSAKILIVDDELTNVLLLTALLGPEGYALSVARSGEEGLARIAEEPPDVVLLDVVMPGIDGFAVLAHIRAEPRWLDLPVVLITGLEDTGDRVRGIELGANDFLTKPVHKPELLARVRSLVRMKQLRDEVHRYQASQRALFELTTLSDSDPSDVLHQLAERVSDLTGMDEVFVSLGPGAADQWLIVAAHPRPAQWDPCPDWLERRVSEVLRAGGPVRQATQEGPYVAVPLRGLDGATRAIVHAFGGPLLPEEEHLQLLGIAGQRISAELQLVEYNAQLEQQVRARTAELEEALEDVSQANLRLVLATEDTMKRLATAAELRDSETGKHLDRMALYAEAIARELGWSEDECRLIRLAAPMHDVGKIGIPDAILQKPGRLAPDEWEHMKDHPLIGAQILGGSSSRLLQMAELIALTHHERYDGAGYPKGLCGEEIPEAGRIVALADVFDALTTKRHYKEAWSLDEAVGLVVESSGKHFDPRVVAAFLRARPVIERVFEVHSSQVG